MSVGLGVVLGSLELDLEPLGSDGESVHGGDGGGGGDRSVVGDEAEALGQVRLLVDEDLQRHFTLANRSVELPTLEGDLGMLSSLSKRNLRTRNSGGS